MKNPKYSSNETEGESSVKKTLKPTSFPITYKGGMEAPQPLRLRGNSRDKTAITDFNQVDELKNTMSPPRRMMTQKVPTKTISTHNTRVEHSVHKPVTVKETTAPTSASANRKPLSSVGLSALKVKTSSSVGAALSSRGKKALAPSGPTDSTDTTDSNKRQGAARHEGSTSTEASSRLDGAAPKRYGR